MQINVSGILIEEKSWVSLEKYLELTKTLPVE